MMVLCAMFSILLMIVYLLHKKVDRLENMLMDMVDVFVVPRLKDMETDEEGFCCVGWNDALNSIRYVIEAQEKNSREIRRLKKKTDIVKVKKERESE